MSGLWNCRANIKRSGSGFWTGSVFFPVSRSRFDASLALNPCSLVCNFARMSARVSDGAPCDTTPSILPVFRPLEGCYSLLLAGLVIFFVDTPDDAHDPLLDTLNCRMHLGIFYRVRVHPRAHTGRRDGEKDETDSEEQKSLQKWECEASEAEHQKDDASGYYKYSFDLFIHRVEVYTTFAFSLRTARTPSHTIPAAMTHCKSAVLSFGSGRMKPST